VYFQHYSTVAAQPPTMQQQSRPRAVERQRTPASACCTVHFTMRYDVPPQHSIRTRSLIGTSILGRVCLPIESPHLRVGYRQPAFGGRLTTIAHSVSQVSGSSSTGIGPLKTRRLLSQSSPKPSNRSSKLGCVRCISVSSMWHVDHFQAAVCRHF
jgi:hypothetical protein